MHKYVHLLGDPRMPKPDYTPIRQELGELMPHLMPGPRGRQRLTLALTQRFGENWRMNIAAKSMMGHFESEDLKLRTYFHGKGLKK